MEKEKIKTIGVRSPEKVTLVTEKFADLVFYMNSLEKQVISGTDFVASKLGYDVGRMMSATKDIMVILGIDLEFISK